MAGDENNEWRVRLYGHNGPWPTVVASFRLPSDVAEQVEAWDAGGEAAPGSFTVEVDP